MSHGSGDAGFLFTPVARTKLAKEESTKKLSKIQKNQHNKSFWEKGLTSSLSAYGHPLDSFEYFPLYPSFQLGPY